MWVIRSLFFKKNFIKIKAISYSRYRSFLRHSFELPIMAPKKRTPQSDAAVKEDKKTKEPAVAGNSRTKKLQPEEEEVEKLKTIEVPEERNGVDVDKSSTKPKVEKKKKEVVEVDSRRRGAKRGTQVASYKEQDEEPVKKRRANAGSPSKRATSKKNKDGELGEKVDHKKGAEKKTTEDKVNKKEPKSSKSNKATTETDLTSDVSENSETKNPTSTDWKNINFDCNKKNSEDKLPDFTITSWNVDGLRAWLKKDGLNILEYSSPDIFCLQEIKCSEDKLPEELTSLDKYHKFWCTSDKTGYAGVGLLSKELPIEVSYGIKNEDQDTDGRCITAEFEKFFVVTVYVPNAGRKLVTLDKRLHWNEEFKKYIKELDEKKPVIICGDMNVAHNEIDLKNPKTNTRNAGFTKEEREGMTEFIQEGFVDTFRMLYPDDKDRYTFWTYMLKSRSRNIGWRLDYFLISDRLKEKVCDNVIHDNVFGSDHCPISLYFNV